MKILLAILTGIVGAILVLATIKVIFAHIVMFTFLMLAASISIVAYIYLIRKD